MKNFFTKDAKVLSTDKSLISLAQGKPVEGVSVAPQLLPIFAAPLAPPASATVAVWKNYHLMMVGFWYRVKFGFAIYKQFTKETAKWLDCTIKYFDMIANGFFSMFTFLSLYTALESLKGFSWTDSKTYAAGYLSWVRIKLAYSLLWWLFNQNTLDILSIQEQLGAIPVDSKVKEWYVKWTPWTMGWAFMHWEVETDLSKWGLLMDGAAWDAAKGNKLAALWYQKKLALGIRGIFYALVADGMPQQQMLVSWVPWLGLSLSWDATAISFHTALSAPSTKKAEQAKAGAAQLQQKAAAFVESGNHTAAAA